MKKAIKENYIAITMFLIFETIAISLFISTKNIFYLLNFTYIGLCITIGLILTKRKNKYSRKEFYKDLEIIFGIIKDSSLRSE